MRQIPNPVSTFDSLRTRACILLGFATAIVGIGCHDAAYLDRRAERDQRIDALLSTIPELQEHRGRSTRWVLAQTERLRAWRWEHLGETIAWGEEVEQARRERCRRNPLKDAPCFRNVRTGHPELIGPTWADMVY